LENYLRLLGGSAPNIIDHLPRLNLASVSNIDELNYIKPAFAALVFADERLWAAQSFRQIDLGELSFMPCADQGGTELGIALAENGSGHAGTLNLLRDYPKIGYYESRRRIGSTNLCLCAALEPSPRLDIRLIFDGFQLRGNFLQKGWDANAIADFANREISRNKS
jgi:hypothetical protein